MKWTEKFNQISFYVLIYMFLCAQEGALTLSLICDKHIISDQIFFWYPLLYRHKIECLWIY